MVKSCSPIGKALCGDHSGRHSRTWRSGCGSGRWRRSGDRRCRASGCRRVVVEDLGALQPQNKIREASKTPQPVLRLHTCRNEWLGAWLRYIRPPRLNGRIDGAFGNQRPSSGRTNLPARNRDLHGLARRSSDPFPSARPADQVISSRKMVTNNCVLGVSHVVGDRFRDGAEPAALAILPASGVSPPAS